MLESDTIKNGEFQIPKVLERLKLCRGKPDIMGLTSESLRKRHETIDAFKTQHSIKDNLLFSTCFRIIEKQYY